MIDYVYKARDNTNGQLVSAHVKAESPEAAAKLLMKQNLFPLEIDVEGQKDILAKLGLGGRVSSKERVLFTRQLSTLINAGLPLARALRTVRDQIRNKNFQVIIDNVVASVEGGSSLSDAFAQHPQVFNEIYVAVAAGETSGTLDKALLRLATQQEKDAAIVSKIRSAMIYPLIVLVLIVGVVGLMLTSVVPQVAKLYSDLKKTLPLPTQILLLISNILVHFWYLVILALVAMFFGARAWLRTERGKQTIDRIKLTVPLFGPLFQKVYMARFARTMNTLLASGIPMLESMATTRNAVANRLIAEDIDVAIGQVRGGKSLSQSLEPSKNFIKLVPQMAKIGEESGALDEMLGRTATYFEDEVDEAVKNLSTTIEPVMMVVLGSIVALVLAAVLGPVYSLIGNGDLTNSSSGSTTKSTVNGTK
jgi:type IV pilus assembly protein PilC